MCEKIYDPKIHRNIILTVQSDEIALLDIGYYRAVLSCGHFCDPNALTEWCRTILDEGGVKFICPAIRNGIKCGKEWSYDEVRLLGLLNDTEKLEFEEKLNDNLAKNLSLKQCPNCDSYIENQNGQLKIVCLWCEKNGLNFKFCWQCENKWLNLSSDKNCGNFECSNKDLEALKNCKFIELSSCKGLGLIPTLRACPTCGKLVEHNGQGCKNIICPECRTEFCF
ncbi:unnamed protein product, partial [Brachionus calyciflorus]